MALKPATKRYEGSTPSLGTIMTYFISGHLTVTPEEFQREYEPRIREKAQEPNVDFVVGDARGTDHLAQKLLKQLGAKVIVFHMFESPRHNEGFPTCGGFTSDRERDAALTAASDHDIAWVRPGRERSGTAKNLRRRAAK